MPQYFNGLFRGCGAHLIDFLPLRIALTIMTYIFPRKGPAKSLWILCQGLVGQIHRYSGADVGVCLTIAQVRQLLARFSISQSNPGHHMASSSTFHPRYPWVGGLKFSQNATLEFRWNDYSSPPQEAISLFGYLVALVLKGCGSFPTSETHPCCMKCNTLLNTGSVRVTWQTWVDVMSKFSI